MSEQNQYKNFTTRRFRADLHHKLRMLAAAANVTNEEMFNIVVQLGEEEVEKRLSVRVTATNKS